RYPVPPYLSEARMLNYFRKEHFDGIMRWGLVIRREQLIKTGEKIQEFNYHLPQQKHKTEETIAQRDTADQAVFASQVLSEFAFPSERPVLLNLPFDRNPCFIGRETELQELHTQLRRNQSVAIGQKSAITGMGGVGKTQLAVEYAYRYHLEYR